LNSQVDPHDYVVIPLQQPKKERSWPAELVFYSGVAYFTGLGLGGTYGLSKGYRNAPSGHWKLTLNSLLNWSGRYGSLTANSLAVGAIFFVSYRHLYWKVLDKRSMTVDALAIATAAATFKVSRGPKTALIYGLGCGLLGYGAIYVWELGLRNRFKRSPLLNKF